MKALAVKYRPTSFSDVTEQGSIKKILQNQIQSGEVKSAYCFVGPAGCGKTTCARIFADAINKGKGMPIELDAASNNSVDNIREITAMAQLRSVDSEYKVFILDEAHMLSAGAWAALLKTLEEPPAKTIFILCTTDYWKIPKTILSRCQRYSFQKISTKGITDRLTTILAKEGIQQNEGGLNAVEFIARISDGCMREAITNLDECLAYSDDLNVANVSKALGLSDNHVFEDLTHGLIDKDDESIIEQVEAVYSSGQDMKQFIKSYTDFMLDSVKYKLTGNIQFTSFPEETAFLKKLHLDDAQDILQMLVSLDSDIKWSQNPRAVIEATFLVFQGECL